MSLSTFRVRCEMRDPEDPYGDEPEFYEVYCVESEDYLSASTVAEARAKVRHPGYAITTSLVEELEL